MCKFHLRMRKHWFPIEKITIWTIIHTRIKGSNCLWIFFFLLLLFDTLCFVTQRICTSSKMANWLWFRSISVHFTNSQLRETSESCWFCSFNKVIRITLRVAVGQLTTSKSAPHWLAAAHCQQQHPIVSNRWNSVRFN